MTDVLARYHRKQGKDVLLVHGADQHGSKNYKKAQEEGMEPQVFVDKITDEFSKVHSALNIKMDRFIKTSTEEHKKSAQAVWKKLLDSGNIYKSTYKGLYCVGCEAFYTQSQAAETGNICPIHKQPLEKIEEENYFFKLSNYTDRVKKSIESDEFKVVPESRKHEILSVLNQGLEDISISRPVSKLPWGVPVPDDQDQVMYVWFEALINYISALGYPEGDFETYWPADVQVIGKDILRFHAAIWPAMLIGIEASLPKVLLVHGFITSGGQKMSKTTGNVVDPFEVMNQYGTDALRYYLLRHIPSTEDGDFTWQKFENAYNGELANDLGNLVQRTASMVTRYQDGVIGNIPEPGHDSGLYIEAMEEFKFDRALDVVWDLIHGLNQYIEAEQPWQLAKESSEQTHLQEVLSYIVGSLMQIGDLLEPFMPTTSENIKKIFASGSVDTSIGVLFPRIHNYTAQTNAG